METGMVMDTMGMGMDIMGMGMGMDMDITDMVIMTSTVTTTKIKASIRTRDSIRTRGSIRTKDLISKVGLLNKEFSTLIIYQWSNGPNQKFYFQSAGDNKYGIFSVKNNQTVEVPNQSNGARVLCGQANKQVN